MKTLHILRESTTNNDTTVAKLIPATNAPTKAPMINGDEQHRQQHCKLISIMKIMLKLLINLLFISCSTSSISTMFLIVILFLIIWWWWCRLFFIHIFRCNPNTELFNACHYYFQVHLKNTNEKMVDVLKRKREKAKFVVLLLTIRSEATMNPITDSNFICYTSQMFFFSRDRQIHIFGWNTRIRLWGFVLLIW